MCFKGIVMDLNDRYAIVMKNDGSMVRINIKDGLKVGMSIFFFQEDFYKNEDIPSKRKINKCVISLIAVALIGIIFICPLIKIKQYDSVYAILTIDVNPSIELKVDKDKKIIVVNGLNEDGEDLDINRLKGLDIEEGTTLLKEMILNNEEIDNKDCILVGFSFLKNIDDDKFEKDVQNVIKDNFNEFNVVYLKGNESDMDNANLKGLSLGRYEASKELNEELTEELAGKVSINTLIELLQKHSASNRCEREVINKIKDKLKEEIEEHNENDDSDEDDDDLEKDKIHEDDKLDAVNELNEEDNIEINDDSLDDIKEDESYEVKDIESHKDVNNKKDSNNNKEKYEADESDDLHEDESDDKDEEDEYDNHEEDDD